MSFYLFKKFSAHLQIDNTQWIILNSFLYFTNITNNKIDSEFGTNVTGNCVSEKLNFVIYCLAACMYPFSKNGGLSAYYTSQKLSQGKRILGRILQLDVLHHSQAYSVVVFIITISQDKDGHMAKSKLRLIMYEILQSIM